MKTLVLLLLTALTSIVNAQVHEGVYYSYHEAGADKEGCVALLQAERKLKKLIPFVCKLENLEHLDMMKNELDSIPNCVGSMTHLKSFYLNENKFKAFPSSICESPSLELLSIGNNEISQVPETIGNLTTLKYLYLYGNKLTALPESMGKLKNLRILEIQANKITNLPNSFKNLTNLEMLNCNGNDISNIMEILPSFKKLKVLAIGPMYGATEEEISAIKAAVPKGCLINPDYEQLEAAGFGYNYPKLWD